MRAAIGAVTLTLALACEGPPRPHPHPRARHPGLAPVASTVIPHRPRPAATPGCSPRRPATSMTLAARRRALERSLTKHDNIYSRTRLGAYGRPDLGWDLLPEWNPRVRAVTAATVTHMATHGRARDRRHARCGTARARPRCPRGSSSAAACSSSYPLRPEIFAEHALARPEVARAVGLHSRPTAASPAPSPSSTSTDSRASASPARCVTPVDARRRRRRPGPPRPRLRRDAPRLSS